MVSETTLGTEETVRSKKSWYIEKGQTASTKETYSEEEETIRGMVDTVEMRWWQTAGKDNGWGEVGVEVVMMVMTGGLIDWGILVVSGDIGYKLHDEVLTPLRAYYGLCWEPVCYCVVSVMVVKCCGETVSAVVWMQVFQRRGKCSVVLVSIVLFMSLLWHGCM